MPTLIVEKDVDLTVYPPINQLIPGEQITIGDLHGNALKFLYFLVRENIFILPKNIYEHFAKNIYPTPAEEITDQQLQDFQDLLTNLKFNPNAMKNKICLLGDELVDRGSNDGYTICFLLRLSAEGMPFEIMISNHGYEFLKLFANNFKTFQNSYTPFNQGRSAEQLEVLMKRKDLTTKFLTTEDLMDFTLNVYIPHLKILSYVLTDNSVDLFMHAPVGLNGIRTLAEELKVFFVLYPKINFCKTIDNINEELQVKLQNPKWLSDIGWYNPAIMPFMFRRYHEAEYANDRLLVRIGNGDNAYLLRVYHGHDGKNLGFYDISKTTFMMMSKLETQDITQHTLVLVPDKGDEAFLAYFITPNKDIAKINRNSFDEVETEFLMKILKTPSKNMEELAKLEIIKDKLLDSAKMYGSEFAPQYVFNLNTHLGKGSTKLGEYRVTKVLDRRLLELQNESKNENEMKYANTNNNDTNNPQSPRKQADKRKLANNNFFTEKNSKGKKQTSSNSKRLKS